MGLWMQACCLPVEAPCVHDKGAHHGYTDSPGQIFILGRSWSRIELERNCARLLSLRNGKDF